MPFTKLKLSGSTDGRGMKLAPIATPGTTVHTAHVTLLDEIWIYAYNSDPAARLLTIEFGGVTAPDDNIKKSIPPQSGLELVVPGLLLTNSTVLKAYASLTNVIVVFGFVNRIS